MLNTKYDRRPWLNMLLSSVVSCNVGIINISFVDFNGVVNNIGRIAVTAAVTGRSINLIFLSASALYTKKKIIINDIIRETEQR